jgi:hypothetical protein
MIKETLGYFVVVVILLIIWISVFRNCFVQYRCRKILKAIGDQTRKEVAEGVSWHWIEYYLRFNDVSYVKVLLMFWKPVKCFYNLEEILK